MTEHIFLGEEWAILKKLDTEIDALRKEMVELAMQYGFRHPDVYACSRRLDGLLLEWHHLKMNEKENNRQDHVYRIRENHTRIREPKVLVNI